jgi:hypothetical protein
MGDICFPGIVMVIVDVDSQSPILIGGVLGNVCMELANGCIHIAPRRVAAAVRIVFISAISSEVLTSVPPNNTDTNLAREELFVSIPVKPHEIDLRCAQTDP